jgi:hypothetical protein
MVDPLSVCASPSGLSFVEETFVRFLAFGSMLCTLCGLSVSEKGRAIVLCGGSVFLIAKTGFCLHVPKQNLFLGGLTIALPVTAPIVTLSSREDKVTYKIGQCWLVTSVD